ncbi:MAG: hypothetical protein CTY20_00080 [Hyphomicrobium sp.]|nr:MAG: hypothetical protein CTY20_00080 [Hyphomicrobium sp.]
MTTTTPATEINLGLRHRSPAAWVVRQAIVGIAILAVVVSASAWLLHSSIDPAAELPAEQTPVRQG